MTRYRLTLLLVSACALGFFAGYLAFGGRPRGQEPGSLPAPTGLERRDASGADPDGRETLVSKVAATPATREALLSGLRARNLALLEENQTLRARLEEELRERAFREGSPAPWPAQVPTRFGKEALLSAVNAAIREQGWKGEVSDVDCKEYPCVLAGHLEGSLDSGVFKRLLGAKALLPYAEDHAQTSVSASTLRDSLGRPVKRTQFGLAFGPGAPPGTEPEVQRTIVRMRLLLDSTRER